MGGLVLVAITVGCSGGGSTGTTMSDDPPTVETFAETSTTATSSPATTSTTLPPDPPVVDATLPQNGAAAPLWDDQAYGEAQFAGTLADLAAAGAGWVTLIPTWYQLEPSSSEIYEEIPGRTASDDALITAIREAKELGLRVILKPHVDLTEGGSRLSIEPSVEEEWFASYTEMILAYASLAATEGVDQFVVGTELAATSQNASAWRAVISEVREVFDGPLTYAANHTEFEGVRFWDDLDFIGVDAYFPLSGTPTTIISTLSESWEPIIESLGAVAEDYDRMVVFTEVGYTSQEGTTVEPYNPAYSEVVSEEEQASALQALIDTVVPQPWFGGFHWWMWFAEDTEAEAALGYMPDGKLAGDILEQYWAAN